MSDGRSEADELELRDFLGVLRRRKLTLVVTALVVVAVALAYAFLQTPTYRASAEVLLNATSTQDLVAGEDQQSNNPNVMSQLVQTEIEVMRSRLVRDAVSDELGFAPTVSIAAKGSTSVVLIRATDTDPDRAALKANTYAQTAITIRRDTNVASLEGAVEVLESQISELGDQVAAATSTITELDGQISGLAEGDPSLPSLVAQRDQAIADRDSQQVANQARRAGYEERLGQLQLALNAARADGGGTLLSSADAPSTPFSPDPVRNGLVGLGLGVLAGAALAFLREYLDDRIRSKDDLDLVTGGVDVLGLIPQVESWRNRSEAQLVSLDAPRSPVAETYRGLRTSVQFIGVDRRVQIIQITSASASEGKSTTLANLGVAFARAGSRVVLVDCDLRRPRLHKFFGLENRIGLTSMILGEHGFDAAVQMVPDVPRLAVLASGPTPPNPSELLSTRTTQRLIESLAEHADYVLLDCPPLLPVADSVVVARHVDATVLVCSAGNTTKRGLKRSLELLDQVDAPLAGVVLNGLDAEAAYAYGYGYGYGADDELQTEGRGLFSRRSRQRYPAVTTEQAAAAPLPESEEDRLEPTGTPSIPHRR